MGKFIIKSRKNGALYFNLKAGNGEIILSGQGYTTKKTCKKGIASVMKNAGDDSKYIPLVSKNKKHYFRLKAGNNKVIGTSEMYESEAALKKGIASVKKNAPGAAISEE